MPMAVACDMSLRCACTTADFLVRGLRAYSDFEYEFRMAIINRKLTGIGALQSHVCCLR